MGNLIKMNRVLSMIEGDVCRRKRFNPVVRVRRISASQLERLRKHGFVVLLETSAGQYSRII